MKHQYLRILSALATLLFLAVAVPSHASEFFDQQPLAEGFVSAVDPFWHLVKINGGELVIDVGGADFRGPAPDDVSSFSAIRVGAHIAVVFQPGHYLVHQPIPATIVQILRQPVGTITGKVESVDVANNLFMILGQPIHVTDQTFYYGSIAALDPKTLAELPVGRDVTVFLDGDLNSLTAQHVYVIAPKLESTVNVSAVVKKIDGNTWYLVDAPIPSFQVTRATFGFQAPQIHVGDTIRMFGRVDDGVVTAESVEAVTLQCPTSPSTFLIDGNVIELSDTSITLDNGTAVVRAIINPETLYDGNTAIGDNADIRVERVGGTLVARLIARVDGPQMFTFLGTLVSIDSTQLTVTSSTLNTPDGAPFERTRVIHVDADTKIEGDPHAGDHVIALTRRAVNGDLTGVSIQKDPRP